MESIAETLRRAGFGDGDIILGDAPRYDRDEAAECLAGCEANLCGEYGRTWACPPGHRAHMDELGERFPRAAVVGRRYGIDPKDREAVEAAGSEMQDAVRRAVAALRASGVDCMGFADGGCRYCGVCAYPEPCRFPEALVPSVSALGVDLGAYLRGLGEGFSFSDDSVTLYGLILLPRPRA